MARLLAALTLAMAPGCVLFERIDDPVLADRDSEAGETSADASVADTDTRIEDSTLRDDSALKFDAASDADAPVEDAEPSAEETSFPTADVGSNLDATSTHDSDGEDRGADSMEEVRLDVEDVSSSAEAAADSRPDANTCDASCASPPASTCTSTTTRRTFASVGICTAGNCSYAPTDTPCATAEVCSNGLCLPRSCDGDPTCNGESCCASAPVPAGSFKRSYDGVTYTESQYQAAVSGFRLDKYEVTVSRFRRFVDAVVGGWTPPAGSGKHSHLNGGNGLAATAGGYEPGWNAAWSATNLPMAKATWDSNLTSCQVSTWTAAAGGNETRPINCIHWYDATAFCIWDGGFLPSEAEWNYAAAGGNEQRSYPWGQTIPGANTDLAIYGCHYNNTEGCLQFNVERIAPVGSVAAGNARWGHSDLAGNVFEWTLDSYATPYAETACIDCAYWASATRVYRGSGFAGAAENLPVSRRFNTAPTGRAPGFGARCARIP